MSNQRKIIIMEDERAIARAMQFKLESLGFTVTTQPNGVVGFPELEEGNYDMLLLDLVMPESDGFDVLHKIQKNKIQTPVVVMTNLSQPEDEARVKDLGAINFFVKSDSPISSIVEYVQNYFNDGSPPRE